jgi:hypothetical protein
MTTTRSHTAQSSADDDQSVSTADRSARYELTQEPDGRSQTARDNLTDILERELLGPAGGDHEELDVQPDTVYLLGRIAPVRLQHDRDDPAGDDAADTPALGDDHDARQSTGAPVAAGDDSSADSGDADDVGNAEDQPQKRGLMIPASMGLRFQIPDNLQSFTVRASWGTYHPVKTDRTDSAGNPARAYRRTPKDASVRVQVGDLVPGRTTNVVLEDGTTLRIDRYDDRPKRRLLIELALCNDRETPRRIPVDAWMFQTQLHVETDGAAAFLPVSDALQPPAADEFTETDDELRRLELQYRDRLEFAIGRTCSVDWKMPHESVGPDGDTPSSSSGGKGPATGSEHRRAAKIWTTWLPTAETPQTQPRQTDDALLDMTRLATAGPEQLEAGLRPIVDGYGSWLGEQDRRIETLPDHLRDDAHEALSDARRVHDQLRTGLDFLITDEEARRCFGFMNQVMADQRIQSQVAALRADDPKLGRETARQQVLARGAGPAHSWYPFQLAFVLMQIEALSKPETDRRSVDNLANVELLFFPTGGGKTEAYLGLAAYTFAVRRRQGLLNTPDGQLDGRTGVAVLMRYTLRLLTAQQFQRATTLICAAELARRQDPHTWGSEPFRIGLWVGTDVSPKRYQEAEEQLNEQDGRYRPRLTVLQIQRCPWCGTKIDRAQVKARAADQRVHVYCVDDLAECPFAEGGSVSEGIPVLTVDEEIYRLVPAFVISTVDKFARLAREGEAAALFGYVRKRCERHGYVHDDYRGCQIKDGGKHPAKDELPAAAVHPSPRLRPPDLIIQDELHLITGALGTTVGLFEVAIDAMTRWQSHAGPVKPLIVASTATVRNAGTQVRRLYGRGLTQFPPQVLDVADTYFSQEVEIDDDHPGRRYVGVSTTGVRLTSAEIRVAEILMAGAQALLDRGGDAADPYLTLVSYFNATRELAGMARYLSDDIQTALTKGISGSRLPRRPGVFGHLNVAELTSRVSSDDIGKTLDQLATSFDPGHDSTQARRRYAQARKAGQQPAGRETVPYDAVLATSMLQVGVDVTRLGLLLMVGQPKNTAEYIQASSRVGRTGDRPGLVVTLGNWARPRDLAHYEQFRHFHETFYARVEPLSVTPFSITSIERGLDGILVSAARVLQADRADGLSPEQQAGRVDQERDAMDRLVDVLVDRAGRAGNETAAEQLRNRLANRLDTWSNRRKVVGETNRQLVYEKALDDSKSAPLLVSAEEARDRTGDLAEVPFVVANSMREVQPEINLLVSPDPDRLYWPAPPSAPAWEQNSADGDDNDD